MTTKRKKRKKGKNNIYTGRARSFSNETKD
jgi:hypothetical protein